MKVIADQTMYQIVSVAYFFYAVMITVVPPFVLTDLD